nr:PREDICTED: ADAMTS-like protein 2 [Lepisosteus oculatus]
MCVCQWARFPETCLVLLGVLTLALSLGNLSATGGQEDAPASNSLEDDSEVTAYWWGEWAKWTACTRTCGGGVKSQERHCLKQRKKTAVGKENMTCTGTSKRYHLCNIKDCPPSARSFREEQCSSFNSQVYNGRSYQWKPLYPDDYVHISSNPCDLHCTTADGQRQLMVLARDGTSCKYSDYRGVCVDGRCEPIGCDGVLFSPHTLDKCGVCRGNGSSCIRVTGNFRRGTSNLGYSFITQIPEGSWDIQIIERKKSADILAVTDQAGNFFFNGAYKVDSPQNFHAAGTIFKYRRPTDVYETGIEYIVAKGPIDQAVNVLVWNQNGRTPYITYEYTVLRDPDDPAPQSLFFPGADGQGLGGKSKGYPSAEADALLPHNASAKGTKEQGESGNQVLDKGPSLGATTESKGQETNEVYEEAIDCEQGAQAKPHYTGSLHALFHGDMNKEELMDGGGWGSQRESHFLRGSQTHPLMGPGECFGARQGRSYARTVHNQNWQMQPRRDYDSLVAEDSTVQYCGKSDLFRSHIDKESKLNGSRPNSVGDLLFEPSESTSAELVPDSQNLIWNMLAGVAGFRCTQKSRQVYRPKLPPDSVVCSYSVSFLRPPHPRNVRLACFKLQKELLFESMFKCRKIHCHRLPGLTLDWPSQECLLCVGRINQRFLQKNFGLSAADMYRWKLSSQEPCSLTCSIGTSRDPLRTLTHSYLQTCAFVVLRAENILNDVLANSSSDSIVIGDHACTVRRCTAGPSSSASRPRFQASQPQSERPSHFSRAKFRSTAWPSAEATSLTTSAASKRSSNRWEASSWSECSRTCGEGFQFRLVRCWKMLSPGLDSSVYSDLCTLAELERPPERRACKSPACGPQWEVAEWTECPAKCGKRGIVTREVRCSDEKKPCDPASRPPASKNCTGPPCERQWTASEWGPCSGSCGQGKMTRHVYCKTPEGRVVPESQCTPENKPLAIHPCGEKDCPAHWLAQDWERCNTTCGRGVKRRLVQCVGIGAGKFKIHEAEDCDAASKPVEENTCFERPCFKWYTTPWSECTKTCGVGVRMRDVKCYQGRDIVRGCDPLTKPVAKQTCALQPCPTEPPDENCQDRPSTNCSLALKVNLCSHWYYSKACCHSCRAGHAP